MRDSGNIGVISLLPVDYMGFIFYKPSKRNALGIDPEILFSLPKRIKPVGVFVDEDIKDVLQITRQYGFKTVQLHGNESPEYCKDLKNEGLEIIKAVRIPEISEENVFSELERYHDSIEMFLFDTAGKNPGGNGIKFDWSILEKYNLPIPFLVSGGIGPDDADLINRLNHPLNIGIDLNSGFEITPGYKDPEKLKMFISKII